MSKTTSTTGLLAAQIQPIRRSKPKEVQLFGSAKPAPFTLRPFAGLFNPYPYGCSVLCNHPADSEAKEVVRRAKYSWATEGKALLLPAEVEMIRGALASVNVGAGSNECIGIDATTVPEELFRKYTEMDSRPLTPAPTLVSGPTLTCRANTECAHAMTCNPRQRSTLILDLRADSQEQEIEILSWHALNLEPAPYPRKNEMPIFKPIFRQRPSSLMIRPTTPPLSSTPIIEISDTSSSKDILAVNTSDSGSDERPMRRRGKRLKRRKCRRGSTYGQQTEVRDPPEPLETQVSQIGDGSGRDSKRPSVNDCIDTTSTSSPDKMTTMVPVEHAFSKSFIDADILRHLSRELNRDMVEEEFSIKRKIALQEALRVKIDLYPGLRASRQSTARSPSQNVPRVFSRQSARFEVLYSQTLAVMKPLDYLSKHVFVTPERKLIFGRAFNVYYEETTDGIRYIFPKDIPTALEEVMGKPLSGEQEMRLKNTLGDIEEPLNFRSWCGVCAAAERLLPPLPMRELDPPEWIERVDFEALERRLRSVEVDPKLALLLREIRDR